MQFYHYILKSPKTYHPQFYYMFTACNVMQKSSIFTRVCHSVYRVGPMRAHMDLFKLPYLSPAPKLQAPSLQLWSQSSPPPHHMNLFQGVHLDSRVHYVAHRSIGKRPVDLRLKGLLVWSCICFIYVKQGSYEDKRQKYFDPSFRHSKIVRCSLGW